jgi:hypothetical protein
METVSNKQLAIGKVAKPTIDEQIDYLKEEMELTQQTINSLRNSDSDDEAPDTIQFMLDSLEAKQAMDKAIQENLIAVRLWNNANVLSPAALKLKELRRRASMCVIVDDSYMEDMRKIREEAMAIYREHPAAVNEADLRFFGIMKPRENSVERGGGDDYPVIPQGKEAVNG